MKLICIEGNIGSGKTTLSGKLAAVMNASVVYEPVDENPYLARYYADPKRYALEMQFWLMSRRFEQHEKAIRHIWKTGQTVIMDRSIYGDWVFAKQNHLDGNIDDAGFTSYCHHRHTMDRYLLTPHVVLFLETKPEKCLERIKSRGRGCEHDIPLTYLEGLDKLHTELAHEMVTRGSQVIPLDWTLFGNVGDIAGMIEHI